MTEAMHIAELNIGRLLAAPEDPRVAQFIDNIDRINGLGKRMPGFCWIMESEDSSGAGNTGTRVTDDPRMISNLTVWETVDHLKHFVNGTLHRVFMEKRREWFEVMEPAHFVMWHVPAGHEPSIDEGLERLEHLRAHGESNHAFGWDYATAHLTAEAVI